MATVKFPVAEIFGPTVQGEGIDQGTPCYFIRFGGCDFKCEWCDTPHAVLPENVKHLPRMTQDQILDALRALHEGPEWVIISGGNPALHELGGLCKELRYMGLRVAVETQGTRYKEWLRKCRVCVSPKPPSSGMKFDEEKFFEEFMRPLLKDRSYDDAWLGNVFVKVVVFDHADYEFARHLNVKVHENSGGVGLPFFVSTGNDAGKTVGNPGRVDERTTEQIRNDLLDKTRWLVNRVMVDPLMDNVRVQNQFHVALWGNELGR